MSSALLINCELPTVPDSQPLNFVRIENGFITEVGPMEALPPEGTVHTIERDLNGRALVPGFIDAHAHVVEAGVERLRCDMTRCRSREQVLQQVQNAALLLESEWIVGRGWDLAHFQANPPTLGELDARTGTIPAYLNNANGHCAWVNTAALALAGITEQSVDPAGGALGRTPDGQLNGMLYESAMNLVNDLIPALTPQELADGLVAGRNELLRYGVTAWQEAIVGPYVQTTDVYETLSHADQDGSLQGRVTGALWWPRDAQLDYIDQLLEIRAAMPPAARFRCTAVKIMHDGSAATQTAAMIDSYLGTSNFGTTFFSASKLADIVRVVDAAGFDVHIHANGDRAVQDALDAIEGAVRTNRSRPRRHQLAHLHYLRDDQVVAMARLGIIAVVQPLWAHNSAKMKDLTLPSVSAAQGSTVYRFGSLAAAGVRLASSSDWPVSTPNPLEAIHVAVNRTHPSGVSDEALNAGEALSLEQALAAATNGAAYALGIDGHVGTVAVGFAADLAILDRPLGRTNSSELHSVQVDCTLIDGKVVFER